MKNEFPNYNKHPSDEVFKKLSKDNQKTINSFLEYCKITSSHLPTHKKIKLKITTFTDIIEKELNSLNLEDLRIFLGLLKQTPKSKDYKTDILKQIKRFLIWKYEDYPQRFSRFEDFKRFSKGEKKKRISSEDLFTTNEINLIIQKIHSIKYKTLIATLFESGCRPEEILNLTWGKVNFENSTIEVYSNKTQRSRVIPLNESIEHLQRFKIESFDTPEKTDFIFPDPRNPKKPFTTSGLGDYFKKIEARLNLQKRFYPYILRHSRLNFLRKKLSPDTYEAVSGHSMTVAMEFYKHLDKEGVIEEMNQKIYSAKLLGEDKTKIHKLEREVEELKDLKIKFLEYEKFMSNFIKLEQQKLEELSLEE